MDTRKGQRTIAFSSARRRRWGARAGLAALWLHVALAAGQAIPVTPAAATDAPRFLVRCVLYGKALRPAGGNGTKVPADRSSCPVCLSGALCQGLLAAEPVRPPVPTAMVLALAAFPDQRPVSGRVPSRRLPRGPPSLI